MRINESEKALISVIAEKYPSASRIFVTGEVHKSYIGTDASCLLLSANEMTDEPLFVLTNNDTIRMTSFDPAVVWRCFHPDILSRLVEEESKRLGVGGVILDFFDYYKSMLMTIKARYEGKSIFPIIDKTLRSELGDIDSLFLVSYLGSLLLFEKTGFEDVSPERFFAMPLAARFMQTVHYCILNERESSELRDLRQKHGNLKGLSNREINFLSRLFDSKSEEDMLCYFC